MRSFQSPGTAHEWQTWRGRSATYPRLFRDETNR